MTIEINIDTLPGPTHSFSGLSPGNIASMNSCGTQSNPKRAALQCLDKMRILMDMGIPQIVFPPLQKPHKALLKSLTSSRTEKEALKKLEGYDSYLSQALFSSATMWTANAATVTPSCDSSDKRVHITPANLASHLHRQLDVAGTSLLLKTLFCNPDHFVVHPPLPPSMELFDEGAANHIRLSSTFGEAGINLFVYGRESSLAETKKYFPRQTKLASNTIALSHGISSSQAFFVQQLPQAIDAGVFHTDVIATGHQNLLLLHEKAFLDQSALLKQVNSFLPLVILEVSEKELPLKEAVSTYLFNSQIVTCPNSSQRVLLAPFECSQSENAMKVLKRIELDPRTNIREVIFIHLDESMKNGGGPACMRLRVELTEKELSLLPRALFLTPQLYKELHAAIEALYPDEFDPLHVTPLILKSIHTTTRAIWILLGLGT